jgi:hypothetical protein
MIIVNKFTFNLSGVVLCPCVSPPPLDCNTIYASFENPIVLEYGAFGQVNTYEQISGFPYFCFTADGASAGTYSSALPNLPFVPSYPLGADAYVCYGPEYFIGGLCITSETETSITFSNTQQIGSCTPSVAFYPFPLGYGGTLTVTWE